VRDLGFLTLVGLPTAGVKNFVYVSTVESNLPSFVLKGYFNGKRRAEKAVLEK
jgi:hypothetical protein